MHHVVLLALPLVGHDPHHGTADLEAREHVPALVLKANTTWG